MYFYIKQQLTQFSIQTSLVLFLISLNILIVFLQTNYDNSFYGDKLEKDIIKDFINDDYEEL